MLFDKSHVFRTFTDIAAFVESNSETIFGDAEVNTVWFCCHQKANDMLEGHDTQDWAYEMQAGIAPMNTRAACTKWIDEQVGDNDPDSWSGWCLTDLQEFWGV